jgi:hypothetical protein
MEKLIGKKDNLFEVTAIHRIPAKVVNSINTIFQKFPLFYNKTIYNKKTIKNKIFVKIHFNIKEIHKQFFLIKLKKAVNNISFPFNKYIIATILKDMKIKLL